MPTLLRTRPLPLQLLIAVVVPIAFGALCGWLLGEDKTLYLVLSILAILGGYVAGQEHLGAAQGALRGLVGGLLFGGSILLVHEATGKAAKATIPHPAIILVAITAVVGVILGALGGRRRARREEEDEEEQTGFDIKRIKRSELIGFLGVIILAIALFLLPWFSTSCADQHAVQAAHGAGGCNPNSKLELASGALSYGTYTGWEVYKFIRWLLLAACIAPFVLSYIIARGHELSWRPGEVTMIVGIVAIALILLDGIVLGRPGGNKKSAVDINIEYGYVIGLLGSFLISLGGFRRQAENLKPKPPGV
ncbi:MAG: hypothetical protein QOG63_260 [Thermoleophilaceae bacterium]|jgi:hypothetical protein|nr:hypothetical protein [Thermoleophilaceae bacterium]